MKIRYKCYCGDKEHEIEVTERPEGGDLVLWMQYVVSGTICVHHNVINPNCISLTMEYVKIPMDESAEGIGQKPHLSS